MPSLPNGPGSPISTSSDRGNSRLRILIFWAILVLFVLLALEGGAFVALQLLLSSRAHVLLWKPDLDVARTAWRNNAAKMDEELGWPTKPTATSGVRDPGGAKVNAEFPYTLQACMSAYGASMVWGDEVPLAEGWIEQLSRQLGCRVANYGVALYGTDQAYLRFRRNVNDKAPVVILGISPDDIVRNVNQYRAFLGYELEPFLVKGRFVIDELGSLKWIRRPNLDAQSYVELHQTPRTFLPNEYFLPDTRDGPVLVRFPYTLSLLRVAMARRLWSRWRSEWSWSDFYSPHHPSGAVPLEIAIATAFVQEAERRGSRVFIIMMPNVASFRAKEHFGAPDYSPFIAAMVAKGLSVFDPMPALAEALAGQSYDKLYEKEGHFGVAGGSLLANVVEAELMRRHLISSNDKPK